MSPVFVTERPKMGGTSSFLTVCPAAFEAKYFVQRYNQAMARGWESKSVEAQQDEAAVSKTSGKPRLTKEAAARLREEETLQLALRSVLQQLERIQDARHRAVLERAAADLERKLRAVDPARGGEPLSTADV